jgi:V/A-type H+-transporting ATPase subunit E
MDVQVQELIDKIKQEGVASAESKAAEIIADAQKKAQAIISEAEARADSIVKTAKAETARLEKSSVDAIEQAGRNLSLSFRDSINAQLASLVARETAKAYSADTLKTLIPEVVKAWVKNPEASDISVLLSEGDLERLRDGLLAALQDRLAQGVDLKADAALTSGFRIGSRDGAAYYDYSSESVAELFSAYLNPRVASIMKDAAVVLSSKG